MKLVVVPVSAVLGHLVTLLVMPFCCLTGCGDRLTESRSSLLGLVERTRIPANSCAMDFP